MKKFKVWYKDEIGYWRSILLKSDCTDVSDCMEDCMNQLMWDVDDLYGCDSQTDGTDIFFTDETGDFHRPLRDISIVCDDEDI